MPGTNLYFIAIIPFKELRQKVTELKRDIATRFHSMKALKVVPHITLKAPFKLQILNHEALLKWFDGVKLPTQPFMVSLYGFGAFKNAHSPVIFVNPVANIPLILLQREIVNSFKVIAPALTHLVDKNFKPHMTIAYRDLTPANFEKAWEEYRNKKFEGQFEINAVHLLQHNGSQWNIIASKALPTA